jgi:hypothetical protein
MGRNGLEPSVGDLLVMKLHRLRHPTARPKRTNARSQRPGVFPCPKGARRPLRNDPLKITQREGWRTR